jgi:hypothetical protein
MSGEHNLQNSDGRQTLSAKVCQPNLHRILHQHAEHIVRVLTCEGPLGLSCRASKPVRKAPFF